jgi:hypothetical protein
VVAEGKFVFYSNSKVVKTVEERIFVQKIFLCMQELRKLHRSFSRLGPKNLSLLNYKSSTKAKHFFVLPLNENLLSSNISIILMAIGKKPVPSELKLNFINLIFKV